MKEFKRILFPVLTLEKKLGFKINKVVGAGEYELSIDFQTN